MLAIPFMDTELLLKIVYAITLCTIMSTVLMLVTMI